MSKIVKLGMEHRKFAYDKEQTPCCHIDSGDTVIMETEDANCSLITKETDLWVFSDIYAAAGGCNPIDGPVYVDGAKKGDFLKVELLNVTPGFLRNGGYTSVQSGVGTLEDINGCITDPLESRTRICPFEDGMLVMKTDNEGECLKVPLNPFVGSIGVAPKEDRTTSFKQNKEWCGNVDLPDIKPGVTVVLPCNVDGGYLYMGDVHGTQGDGEITGCALECQGIIEAKVSVAKADEVVYCGCPQVNCDEWIGSIGIDNGGDLAKAMKMGYTDLVRRLEKEYGIPKYDGYMLLNLAGTVRIGNELTCLCKVPRSVLKKYKC